MVFTYLFFYFINYMYRNNVFIDVYNIFDLNIAKLKADPQYRHIIIIIINRCASRDLALGVLPVGHYWCLSGILPHVPTRT